MLGKKMLSFKKLVKKVKVRGIGGVNNDDQHHQTSSYNKSLLIRDPDQESPRSPSSSSSSSFRSGGNGTPTGFFTVYVGEGRQKFVVSTNYLSHPLFKMLLEKAYDEFGFDHKDGIVVPCSVSTFQEVVNAVEGFHGKFDFGHLVEEFI